MLSATSASVSVSLAMLRGSMVRGIVKILHDDVFSAHCETVAITRARALLIVVGDPDILCLDGVWQGFLAYVKKNGGWRGKGVDCASKSSSPNRGGARRNAAR